MAVANQAEPVYEFSALYWFDRSEEVFGRKTKECAMQESGKYFDTFVATIPDMNDLRNVAETLHVMLLRGYSLKLTGRSVAETAICDVMLLSARRQRFASWSPEDRR